MLFILVESHLSPDKQIEQSNTQVLYNIPFSHALSHTHTHTRAQTLADIGSCTESVTVVVTDKPHTSHIHRLFGCLDD